MLIITFTLMKVLFYLRVYEEYCNLIILMQDVVIKVSTFIVFLLLWMVYFNMLYTVMEVDFDGEDYPAVSQSFVNILQGYRNSIGDIAVPTYKYWE